MNCKIGDLAYVVGGEATPPRNLGRVVEVMSLEGIFDEYGPVWNVQSSQLVETTRGLKYRFHMCDARLRPIGGVPIHDEVSDDIKEPV